MGRVQWVGGVRCLGHSPNFFFLDPLFLGKLGVLQKGVDSLLKTTHQCNAAIHFRRSDQRKDFSQTKPVSASHWHGEGGRYLKPSRVA